jgi:hypothetical protein
MSKPLTDDDLSALMMSLAEDLGGTNPIDVLSVAGFLASTALRCWNENERMGIAKGFTRNIISQTRQSLG